MHISFQSITGQELQNFCNDVKAVLSIAVVEQFGIPENGEVITDAEVMEILHNSEATVYNIYANGEKAGGVALRINDVTHRNSMDLFYLYPEFHGRGLGYHAWKMIEGMYPETEVWELVTPYFEKRNIHFYVNKCGFHIVEFFCKYHVAPETKQDSEVYKEEYFRFEKRMRLCK